MIEEQGWTKRRVVYFVSAVTVVILGLASRQYGTYLPVSVAEYAGDILWALMVFLGVSIVFPAARLWRRGLISLVFAYAVEFSQLYHAPWIDAIRQTTLGGLVLGFSFVWSDLACYTAGIAIGLAFDYSIWSKYKS